MRIRMKPRPRARLSSAVTVLTLLGALSPGLSAQATPTLERVLALPADPYSDELSFHEPIDVALDVGGDEVFVVDNFRRSVRVFDRSGRLLREFGRPGAGPGDLAQPFRIDLAPGRIVVNDGGNQRVTWFTPSGVYEGSRRHPDLEPGRRLRHPAMAVPVRHGQLIAKTEAAWGSTGGVEPRMETLVGLVGRDGRMVQELDRFMNGWGYAFYRTSPHFTSPVWAGLHPEVVWNVSGDSLYVSTDGYRGIVRWHEIGRGSATAARTRELGWSPQPAGISDAEVMEMRRQEAESPARDRDPEDVEIVLPEFRGGGRIRVLGDDGGGERRRLAETRSV